MKNTNLHNAKVAKNDEFYTLYEDIESECLRYQKHFEGKVIYCNCDNPFSSNFFNFFLQNFTMLKLKKLICTCVDENSTISNDLFFGTSKKDNSAYKVIVNDNIPDLSGDGEVTSIDVTELINQTVGNMQGNDCVTVEKLSGDGIYPAGDFRSRDCVELMKESDIIVTNPPFSLFREFIAQIRKYEKQFLVIGSQNAITYKEIFPLLKDNKVWLGYNYVKNFKQPNGEMKQFGNICWFTNLDIRKRHEEIFINPFNTYNEIDYPKYDNYEAIEVSRVADIPCDYDGVMGVPITFLDKYNPEQFEIIGHEHDLTGDGGVGVRNGQFMVNDRGVYKRILIKYKH